MGLYEKAKQYMYEKKLEVLTTLEKRQYRNIFEEDEHLISLIIKECSYLLKKSEGNEIYINRFISSFVFENAVDLNSSDFLEAFISLLKNELNIDSFLFYNNQDKKCVLDEACRKNWDYSPLKDSFKSVDFNLNIEKENLEKGRVGVINLDFLSLLKEHHKDDDEFSITLESSNVASFCVLDENLKPFVFFVFASESVDFPKEDIVDTLKMAAFIFYYFYISKLANEYEAQRNSFSYILRNIEGRLDRNSSIYINVFKLKHSAVPKKFKETQSVYYESLDSVLLETKNIENIFCLGNYYYITITDNEMLSKQHFDSFKLIIDKLKNEVSPTISFDTHRVDYPSKKFVNRDQFMDYIVFLLDTGKIPVLVHKPSKKVVATKTAKKALKKTSASKPKAKSKKTTQKSDVNDSNQDVSVAKKSSRKKK